MSFIKIEEFASYIMQQLIFSANTQITPNKAIQWNLDIKNIHGMKSSL